MQLYARNNLGDEEMSTKADRIRLLRRAKGWSQEELADQLNRKLVFVGEEPIGRAAISQWERGESRDMKNITLYFLCEVLGASHEFLLFGADRRRDRIGTPDRRSQNNGSKA